MDKILQTKCGTKNEVRKLLDLPVTLESWGEEIAGFEQPPDPMMGDMQAGGVPVGAEEAPAEALSAGDDESLEDIFGVNNGNGKEEPEVQAGREVPGKLGEGAQGPRKSLSPLQGRRQTIIAQALEWAKQKAEGQSLYGQLFKSLTNGVATNGRH